MRNQKKNQRLMKQLADKPIPDKQEEVLDLEFPLI